MEENNIFLSQMAKVKKFDQIKKEEKNKKNQNIRKDYASDIVFNLQEVFKPKPELKPEVRPEPKPKIVQEVFKSNALQTNENGQAEKLDDASDFLKFVSDVKSIHKKGREIPPEVKPEIIPQAIHSNPMQDFMDGKLEFSIHSTDQYVEGHVLGLDLMTLAKLQARQYSPEAHIDLHGLNSEQAYNNLIGFFRNSYHRGLRTVLVVTGKGRNSLDGTPILRAKVQEWFTKEPFKRVVLAFCSAKMEDGGAGALYVLVRKRKKEYGKIQWDIGPVDPDLFL